MNQNKKNLANQIRTNLLITINNELTKLKNSKHNELLVNSIESNEYEKNFENFVILERDAHMSSNINLTANVSFTDFFNPPPNYYQTEKNFISQKIKLSKRRNAIFKIRKKRHIDFYLKKEYEIKKKKINESIRSLRFFCSHLKSREEINNKNNQRNKSAIVRRKKFSHIISQKGILTLRDYNNLKTQTENEKDSENVIKLHKMWKSKKKKLASNKNLNTYYLNTSPKKNSLTSREDLIFNE